MTVPAGRALASLGDISSAFAGALFISLTAGVSVSTISILWIITCTRFFQYFIVLVQGFKSSNNCSESAYVLKSYSTALFIVKHFLIKSSLLYFSIWGFITILLIITGAGRFTAAYTVIIPFVVFLVFTLLSINNRGSNKSTESPDNNTQLRSKYKILILLITTILITGTFYYFQCDRGVFLRARDYLLLSSRQGQTINDFYYKYTPYAAEAIKSSSYNQMKLLCLSGLTVTSPVILYSATFLLIFSLVNCIIDKFITTQNKNTIISGIIAGTINILLSLFILHNLYPLSLIHQPINTKAMLEHSDYRIRVEGLRELCRDTKDKNGGVENRKTIWNYPKIIENWMRGNIVEKYWLANSFATAKNPAALPYLEKLLEDPSINVQCAAIDAMATIGMNESGLDIAHILRDKIVHSDEWYVQQRAYKALKKIRSVNLQHHLCP